MLFSSPMNLAKIKLPARPNGTERITANGMNRLSYNPQSTRYISMMQMAKMMTVLLPVPASSRVMPPKSYPYPEGSTSAATSRMALIASPEEYPSAAEPLTAMLLNRLKRVTDSAP